MDLAETVEMSGINTETGEAATRIATRPELLEHEVVGEAQGVMDGLGTRESHAAGTAADNLYRERNGIPFRREPATEGRLCNRYGQCQ